MHAPAKDVDTIEMQPITNGERSRTYFYPVEDGITAMRLENVTHLAVRPSGTHRLKTADGKLHIVAAGWLRIEVDADCWSL